MKLVTAAVNEDGRSHVVSTTEFTDQTAHLWSGDLGDIHEMIERVAPGAAATEIEPGPGGVKWVCNVKQPDTDPSKGYGMHVTRTIDFDFVVRGQVDCVLDDETVNLQAGDAIVLKAASHRWWNPGPGETVMLYLLHQPADTTSE